MVVFAWSGRLRVSNSADSPENLAFSEASTSLR